MHTNFSDGIQGRGETLAILRLKEVKARTGLSRSSIYLKVGEGTFPRQINLGVRSVGWLESDINNWIVDRVRSQTANTTGARRD